MRARKFAVGDAEPVGPQPHIPLAVGTGDEDVINAILDVLVKFGLIEEVYEGS